jgi:hypothetical protein
MDQAANKAALDKFGQLLMKRVRDQTIFEWDMIIDGRAKGVTAKHVHEMLSSFDAQQLEVLHRLVPDIVDTTLHHLLWTLEQEKSVDVAVHTAEGVVPSLREVSDGLAGELYDWIPRFSQQRYERKA